MRKSVLSFVSLLFGLASLFSQSLFSSGSGREVLSFDRGWRFHYGEISISNGKGGHAESYNNTKTGNAKGVASIDFDDTEWRMVNLPHDWSVELGFDSTLNGNQGYRYRGIGWYRRSFNVDAADRGKSFELRFDGISTYATIWINGIVLHRNWCGYTSSYLDITPFLKYGEEINSIAVRVDASTDEGWYYEGAGIYRHTWLIKTDPVHITADGIYANPLKKGASEWVVPVEVTLQNSANKPAAVEVSASLIDADGKVVVSSVGKQNIGSFAENVAKLSLKVSNPKLWWVEKPNLYQVKTVIKQNGKVIDQMITNCGFRTLRFDADKGFFLNDVSLKIKGTCNHQDHAGVGVAVPDALLDFRIKVLKEMGSNAYRCSHNPPSKELLDACDRLGMLVMDENRNFNVSPEYQKQYEWWVRRDRNHPSVFMWSLFNEEPLQGTEIGYQMALRAKAFVNALDTTRAVTAAMNGGHSTPVNSAQAVDVVGFNYFINRYDPYHSQHPTTPIISSEDVSAVAQRGVFATDKKHNILSDYDTDVVSWGGTNRGWWKAIAERQYMAGCFVWTGFDYRGEPSPFKWPTISSNFGNVDLCGFPKSAFYAHQALWLDKPILKLVAHWYWPKDSIGKAVKVMAYSNADSLVLYLNGKLIDAKKIDKYDMGSWTVPYQPGKLEVKAYKNGKYMMNDFVETTGKAFALQLIPYRKSLGGDGQDATPITVQVVDEKGRKVHNANFMVDFEVKGPARNIGVGNGDPNCHESEKANQHSLYNGLAQLILQSNENSQGKVTVVARAKGLKDAVLLVDVKDTIQIATVNIAKPQLEIVKWRVSQWSKNRPDGSQEIADFDMNSWDNFKPGQTKKLSDRGFYAFKAQFTPYIGQQKEGGKILFKKVFGKAEIWLDNKMVFTKSSTIAEDISVPLPAKNGNRSLTVISEGEKGESVGLGGMVVIE